MSITKSQRKKLVPNSFLYQRIISWVDVIYNQGVTSTSRPGSGDHTSCCCRHTFLLRFDFSANRYTHPLLTSPRHQMGSWGLAERDSCCLYPSPARRHTTYSVAAELSQQSHHLFWANGCFSASIQGLWSSRAFLYYAHCFFQYLLLSAFLQADSPSQSSTVAQDFFNSVNQGAPKHGVEQAKKIIPPKIAPS